MANIDYLRSKMDESRMTVVAIAEKSGILRETLYNRLNGKRDFTASEIVGLDKQTPAGSTAPLYTLKSGFRITSLPKYVQYCEK